MKRRNLMGSLLAGIGLLAGRYPLSAAALQAEDGAPSRPAGPANTATVRVIYADAANASWEALTNGGILATGATALTFGGKLNDQIIRDAANAIVAAGGPALGRQQIALFGGQS